MEKKTKFREKYSNTIFAIITSLIITISFIVIMALSQSGGQPVFLSIFLLYLLMFLPVIVIGFISDLFLRNRIGKWKVRAIMVTIIILEFAYGFYEATRPSIFV